MYDEITTHLCEMYPEVEKSRSWAKIYMTVIDKLLMALKNKHTIAVEWLLLGEAKRILLIQLRLHGLSIDSTLAEKNKVKLKEKCLTFIKHLGTEEFYFMLIRTLDDTKPMEESVANFIILTDAYDEHRSLG